MSAPVAWNAPEGKNILWKTEIPKPGASSPVVWDDKIFLTGADGAAALTVFCLDAGTGKILWQNTVEPGPGAAEMTASSDTGYAAPTMAVDGRRAFAMFSTGDVAAFDFSGKPLWTIHLGVPENMYGHASSLILYDGKLLVQFDRTGRGSLLALDAESGKKVWETPREVMISWASPILANTGTRTEVILFANSIVASYDAETGKELWKKDCLSGEVSSSPAFAGGLVLAAQEGIAIRPGEKAEQAWQVDEDLPDVSSPAATDAFLFTCSSSGTVSCRETATGKLLWKHDFDNAEFWPSPVIACGRVYALDKEGVMHILKADKEYSEVGACPVGEACYATPAFANGSIYIRGAKHLFAIGGEKP